MPDKDWKKKKLEEKECKKGYVPALRKLGRGKNSKERARQVTYCKKLPSRKTITDLCDVRNDGDPSVTGDPYYDQEVVDIIEDENVNEMCTTDIHPGTNASKLFCIDTLNIPKEEMPNLADTIYIRNADTNRFLEYLDSRRVGVIKKYVEACTLRSTQNQIYAVTVRRNVKILQDAAKRLGHNSVIEMFENLSVDMNPYSKSKKTGQFELDQDKINAIVDALPAINMSQPIIISRDNYIVDGHHRWATMLYFDLKDKQDIPILMEVYQVDMPIRDLLAIFEEFCDAWGECKLPKEKPK